MLSFTQVHRITDRLLAVHTPNQVLTIHRTGPAGRRLRTISVDLPAGHRLTDSARSAVEHSQRRGSATRRVDTGGGRPDRDQSLLAVAVVYDEDTGSDGVLRRVDAVDTDGRLYQVTRYPDRQTIFAVDDTPDPRHAPPSWLWLTRTLTGVRTVAVQA